MKTLEKDRTRRYESAKGLAEDIQRHLQNEAVTARPPSNLYRFQKLVRRNKLVFSATSAVAVALILGFGVSTWIHWNDPEFAARQAVIQAQKALGNDNPGLPVIMLRLVDVLKENHKTAEAREWAEEAAALYRSHPDWNVEKRKEVLDTLSQELKELGEFNEAVSVQEERLQVLRAHRAADDPELRNALAELAWTYLLVGKYIEAEPIARECLAICQKTLPDDSGTFWVQSMLGESLTRQKRYAEAEPLLLAAYDGFEKHEDEIGTDWRAREIIASMAHFYEATHQPEKVAEWEKKERDFEKAQNATKSAGSQPESSLAGIEATRRQELADARKRLAKDSPELPNYIINLIEVLVADGKGDEASLLGDEVIGLNHSHPDWPAREREDSLGRLNGIFEEKGMYGASASVQAEHLSILRTSLPADDPELRDALDNYAWILYAINEPVKGEEAAREYLAICERKYPGYYRIGFVQSVLGGCLTKQEKYKEAEPLLLAGYEGVMAHKDQADVGDGTQFLWEPTARLVWFYEQTGRPEEAAKWKQKLDELEKADGKTNSVSQSP
jgi:eukaryotic-like serine/threonine-protein kinase